MNKVELSVYDETAPNVYFVVFDGMTGDLRKLLRLGEEGGGGEGVVVQVRNLSGYTYASLWEWICPKRSDSGEF